MADQTTGELKSVSIGDLSAAPDIYDDLKMPGEMQGDAVHITGAQFKQYAQSATKSFSESASKSAETAEGAKTAAQSALAGVREALNNLPEGDTLIINDLTTGGVTAALSAEQGKVLGHRPNPNLLHNWYFADPINQRGLTEYSGNGYTIDRWRINHSTASITLGSEGITLRDSTTGYLAWRQIVEGYERFLGQIVTVSCLVTDISGTIRLYAEVSGDTSTRKYIDITGVGLWTVTFAVPADADRLYITFSTRSGHEYATIKAVKLELGSVQTLAHQDENGNWVLNDPPPNKALELAKCQRYQVDIGGYYPVAVNSGGMSYTFFVQLPFDMRGTPNVDLSNAVITTSNVQADTSGKLSLSDFRGRTMKISFVPTVAPVTLGDAVLNIPVATIADANL